MIVDLIKRAFYKPNWKMAYRENDDDSYDILKTEGDFWCADPFVIKDSDNIYIFCECYLKEKKKGTIAAGEYKNGKLINMRTIIEQDYHMSYPCVFKYNSEYYMVPETSENKTIELYKAVQFPYDWKLINILKQNLNCVDSTVLTKDDELFLIGYIWENKKNKIKIFKLDMDNKTLELLDEIEDENRGRPAGNVFFAGDKIIRPTQVSEKKYGESIAFKEIKSFEKNNYFEEEFKELKGKDIRIKNEEKVHRVHTINKIPNFEIIDYSVDSFDLVKPFKTIKKKLSSYFSKTNVNSSIENNKIAFVIGNMQRDGAERVIAILADHYCKKGWDVDILMLLDSKCQYNLNNKINLIPICRKSENYYANIFFWLKGIRKYVKEKNPDKIVSFFARINILTLLSCIGLKKSIIVSERNDPFMDGRKFLIKKAADILYPVSDSVVFQTKWAQSLFSQKIKNKSVVIPNPTEISTEASMVKSKKIVAVGRLTEQKNHSLLIKAFKIIHEIHPEYKLYIYGEGNLRSELTKEIQCLNLIESVFLPGNVIDVHERISDAEIFVLSSIYEGLSNALLESMLMGIPCISTNCAGSNEIIKNNYNGILIQTNNVKELSQAINYLIENKYVAKKMSTNAVSSVQFIKKENIISKWESIIEN